MFSICKMIKPLCGIVSIAGALLMTGCGAEKTQPVEKPVVEEPKVEESPAAKRKPITYTAEQMKTTRTSVAEFDSRFAKNFEWETMGQAIKPNDDEIIYWLDEAGDVTLTEFVTVQGGLRRVEVTVHQPREDTFSLALICYTAAIMAFNPYADPNKIFKMLGLDATIAETITKPQEVEVNGVVYTRKLIGRELQFVIAEQ